MGSCMDNYCTSVRFTRDGLHPMLPAQVGVCDVCYQGTSSWRCASCARALDHLVMDRPTILPIALRTKGSPLGHATWAYKNSESSWECDEEARRLAWLVEHFMIRHERCAAAE